MRTLAYSEDPDEMPHRAAFHRGLLCLLRQKRFSEKEKHFFFLGGGGGANHNL